MINKSTVVSVALTPTIRKGRRRNSGASGLIAQSVTTALSRLDTQCIVEFHNFAGTVQPVTKKEHLKR